MRTLGLLAGFSLAWVAAAAAAPLDYEALREAFVLPDHARWGEVPLWWWEGQAMTKEHATDQLETLAAKGVKAVCPIQRSPGRCDPASFSPEWWDLFAHVNTECRRLGMQLWAYDQVGYGHYGWLEKAAAEVQDPRTKRLLFEHVDAAGGETLEIDLPDGEIIGARAYPLRDGFADDAGGIDLATPVQGRRLEWTPPAGNWRVAIMAVAPFQSFYLSDTAADAFIDMFYGKLERVLGTESMGTCFGGIFQDEHPPTPRDIYTEDFVRYFLERFGYPATRAIPALHFDVGPLTPKYRTDFLDAYLKTVELTYWKRVYEWTCKRGLLTSHDNWGRNNIVQQSQGYIDYFRSQRWFSAPGFDDAGQHPLRRRNYYDTKVAASIARLYGRPRVWNEAFHSSGWGRTTEQTLVWLSTGMAFGANLYDEHGLYYATNASTWEHAAPDPHWRQPYWIYYNTLSDFVARSSYLMSQGRHVVDIAVHYPVASLLAGEPPGAKGPDYNRYIPVSRTIFQAGMDNDIIDDDSILAGAVRDGRLLAGGNGYQALVFGPETTARRSVLEKALALAESGGTVLFFEQLPSGTTEGGRADPQLAPLLDRLLGSAPETQPKTFPSGGFCAFVPRRIRTVPKLLGEHIQRDVLAEQENLFVTHRRINDLHVYLLQNADEGNNIPMKARFRADGVPEWWDPFSGAVMPVDAFERKGGYTTVEHRIEGNVAHFLVFRPGKEQRHRKNRAQSVQPLTRALDLNWAFSAIATRDNRWGEFRWPPSEERIGPEVRVCRYREEAPGTDGAQGWHLPEFDDAAWTPCLYSTGPYWLVLTPSPDDRAIVPAVLEHAATVQAGSIEGDLTWQEVAFSKSIGAAQAAPWGGHSGYPDGHIDKNFVHVPEGRKLLLSRIVVQQPQRRGLRVELRNRGARLWVNGKEEPFEDAVGNLPLRAGENTIVLDLPDGGHGRLYVQAEPPSVVSMEQAARGMVQPDIGQAAWIWAGDAHACHVRKTFLLDQIPEQARVIVSAYSGYRLFVNGVQIEEEIGPWSDWTKPESFTITPHLKKGKNVVALWGQLFAGQNVNKGPEAFRSKGIVLALKMRHPGGSETSLLSDATWKGATEGLEGWQRVSFDDAQWPPVQVAGHMGDAPWGDRVLQNVGVVTEPKRPLSVDLESPYLTCFDELPNLTYDVKPEHATRVGWYRFDAPPGLRQLALPTEAKAQVWVDGIPAPVQGKTARITQPPKGVSKVAIRLEMLPGAYAGAAFPKPIGLTLEGGTIQPGLWSDYALPTYSGIGVYTQSVNFNAADLRGRTWLDLGQVLVAAEVFVNGKTAGVRLARPFKYEITNFLREGDNTIEIRVANTAAPHYQTIPAMNLGPTDSGMLGPVQLIRQPAGRS